MWINSLALSYLGISKPNPAVVRPLSNTEGPWRTRGRQRLTSMTHHEVLSVKSEPSRRIADTSYGHDRSTQISYPNSKLVKNEFTFLFYVSFPTLYTCVNTKHQKIANLCPFRLPGIKPAPQILQKNSLLAYQQEKLSHCDLPPPCCLFLKTYLSRSFKLKCHLVQWPLKMKHRSEGLTASVSHPYLPDVAHVARWNYRAAKS